MRLATFLPPGQTTPRAGEVHDDEVISFVVKRETVLERLRTSDYDPAIGDPYKLADVTLLAPVPRPRAIFGIGLNYAAHAAEQGKEPPEFPIVFMKLPSSSAPPFGAVTCPDVVKRLDYEGELVVVMGADAKIAGYAVANDVSPPATCSAASRSGRAPRAPTASARGARGSRPPTRSPTRRTCASRRTSTASCARTPRPPTSSSARRSSSTSSRETCTLEPGDLILTGTPSGVGMSMDPRQFLQSGDVVRIEIETLGAIEHAIA